MVLLSNIVLLIVSIFITVLPFLGNLTDKRRKGVNMLTAKGKGFAFAIIIFFGVGILKELWNNQEEADKDKRNSEIQSNVSNIKDTLAVKFQGFDSLISQLDKKTLKSIEEREKALAKFDKISAQLNRIAENEKQSVLMGRPDIVISKDPFFKVIDSLNYSYSFRFGIRNNGDRLATNINIKIVFFEFINDSIVGHKDMDEFGKPTNPSSSLASYLKSGLSQEVFYDNINLPGKVSISKYSNSLFALIHISYVDKVTNQKQLLDDYFTWKNFLKDGNKFVKCSNGGYNLIHKYIKENNIVI
jgi:hypothetical protein